MVVFVFYQESARRDFIIRRQFTGSCRDPGPKSSRHSTVSTSYPYVVASDPDSAAAEPLRAPSSELRAGHAAYGVPVLRTQSDSMCQRVSTVDPLRRHASQPSLITPRPRGHPSTPALYTYYVPPVWLSSLQHQTALPLPSRLPPSWR